MIEREVDHAKNEKVKDTSPSVPAESEGDSSPTSSLCLEICDRINLGTEPRPRVEHEIDGLNKVGSVWISIARLGVANLEGKLEGDNKTSLTIL